MNRKYMKDRSRSRKNEDFLLIDEHPIARCQSLQNIEKPSGKPRKSLMSNLKLARSEKPNPVASLKPNLLIDEEKQEEEALKVKQMTNGIHEIKEKIYEKKKLVEYLMAEVVKMKKIFEKLANLEELKKKVQAKAEDSADLSTTNKLSYKERLELLEKGPFNLVFHGVEQDWIEEEMDDDPDFKRDVLEQKLRKIIKEEAGLVREIPLLDTYRLEDGPKFKGTHPVVVRFKNRKDKEHVMWRSREKLRKMGIILTEDSTTRLTQLREEEDRKEKEAERMLKKLNLSPRKRKLHQFNTKIK